MGIKTLDRNIILLCLFCSLVSCTKKGENRATPKLPLKVVGSANESMGFVQGFDTKDPSRKIFFENMGGYAVIDGDVAIGKIEDLESIIQADHAERLEQKNENQNSGRGILAISTGSRGLWPNATVPYQFGKSVPPGLRKVTRNAMKAYMSQTVLKFEELPDEEILPFNKLVMRIRIPGRERDQCGDLPGFVALAGRVGPSPGASNICAGSGVGESIMMHEIGHILGFYHEQQRPDRDNFVDLIARPERVLDCAITNGAFRKHIPGESGFFSFTTAPVGMYDFGSIMHYPMGGNPAQICSGKQKGAYGVVILERKSGLKKGSFASGTGQRKLSAQDVININLLYTGKAVAIPINLKMTELKSNRATLSVQNIAGESAKIHIEYTEANTENWRIGTQTDTKVGAIENKVQILNLIPDTDYEFRAFTTKPHSDGELVSLRTESITARTETRIQAYRISVKVVGLLEGENANLRLNVNPESLPGLDKATESLFITQNGTVQFQTLIDGDIPTSLALLDSSKPHHRRCSVKENTLSNYELICPDSYIVSGKVTGVSGVVTVSNGIESISTKANYRFTQGLRHGTTLNLSVSGQARDLDCISKYQSRIVTEPTNDNDINCIKKTYTLSGNAVGINANVVLSLNGKRDLMISQDGPFSFPSGLEAFSAYKVTIKQQPSGRLCTVESGEGVLAEQNLTNIHVNCGLNFVAGKLSGISQPIIISNGIENLSVSGTYQFPNPFPSGSNLTFTIVQQPLGFDCKFRHPSKVIEAPLLNNDITCSEKTFSLQGTVKGLSGNLTIRLNNSELVNFSSNGTVTFSRKLKANQDFDVQISKQPLDQVCNLIGGSGKIIDSSVTSVEIDCNLHRIKGKVLGASVPISISNGLEKISANGNFEFPTLVSTGTVLDMTTEDVPQHLNCIPKIPSVTVNGPVSSIEVSCAPKTFVLSGTVTGLKGPLSLRTLGNKPLLMNTNGTFSFPVGLLPHSSYFVSVVQQPPGQVCSISPSEGVMPENHVNNLNVLCVDMQFLVKITIKGLSDLTLLKLVNGNSIIPMGEKGYVLNLNQGDFYDIKLAEPIAERSCVVLNGAGTIQNANGKAEIQCAFHPIVITGVPANIGYQHVYYEFNPVVSNLPSQPYKLSLVNQPHWMKIDKVSGKISGNPDVGGEYKNIILRASIKNGSGQPDTVTDFSFDIKIHGDPLLTQAWYFQNLGQSAFAAGPGTVGQDLAIFKALYAKPEVFLTGREIKVGLIGGGIDHFHEDLKQNLVQPSVDYRSNREKDLVGSAGTTAAAGIIAAVGWNNLGSRGIAPHSKILDLNVYHTEVDFSQRTVALSDALAIDADVFLNLGTSLNRNRLEFRNAEVSYLQSLKKSIETGRLGRGAVHILASANDDSYLRGIDSNFNELANNPYVIATTSSNAFGQKSSSATMGSNIWVSGMGGEIGSSPSVISTDLTGCTEGISQRTPTSMSLFNFDALTQTTHVENLNCNYTNTVNSQEAAAATVAGVAALLLEANPELSWRDIKYILARTATQPSIDMASFRASGFLNLVANEADHVNAVVNYFKNSAGFKFSRAYGFGRINAKKAVEMAIQNYQSPFSTPLVNSQFSSGALDVVIRPEQTGSLVETVPGLSTAVPATVSSIQVPEGMIIEGIAVKVNLDHSRVGDLGIALVSGKRKSILLTQGGYQPNNENGLVPNLRNQIFFTNAFYQEMSQGAWSLEITNLGRNPEPGVFKSWEIQFYGRKP